MTKFVINNSYLLIFSTQNGETALQVAAFYGYNNLVKKLIEDKSDINYQDRVRTCFLTLYAHLHNLLT